MPAKDLYHHSLIIGSDWLWQKFIASLPASFPDTKGRIFLTIWATHIPLERVSYVESPDAFLAAKDTFRASGAAFEVSGGKLLKLVETRLNPANPELSAFIEQNIATMSSLVDLPQRLPQFTQADWAWIDFYAGVVIPRNSVAIGARDLWLQYLKPWSPWLR